jgi:hypothetical protein
MLLSAIIAGSVALHGSGGIGIERRLRAVSYALHEQRVLGILRNPSTQSSDRESRLRIFAMRSGSRRASAFKLQWFRIYFCTLRRLSAFENGPFLSDGKTWHTDGVSRPAPINARTANNIGVKGFSGIGTALPMKSNEHDANFCGNV